jgi:hypothetical protein
MKQSRGARSDIANAKREVGAGIYARISALLKGKQPEPASTKPQTPYEIVFQSKYRGHRIQIDSPADVIDNRGRKTMGRTLFAQFREGHFSIPKWIKDADAEYMLNILRTHPKFNQDFWEEKDNSHEIRVAQVARVVDMLEKNRDIKDTVLDYLTERDFVEPALDGLAPPDLDALAEDEDEDEDAPQVTRRKSRKPVRKPVARKPVRGRRAQSSI